MINTRTTITDEGAGAKEVFSVTLSELMDSEMLNVDTQHLKSLIIYGMFLTDDIICNICSVVLNVCINP